MAKYNAYIELSPHYESVVDIASDQRNPNMWQEYIVHEDMVKAIEKICESLKFEDIDKRRSFWIHGAYGTGKSYAAIVLKHLFEDNISEIEKFFSKQQLTQHKDKFLSIRKKGEYLVIWKSQATDITSGTQLMMSMEQSIREKLAEKYGDKAYYGKSSLIKAAKEAVNDSSINWEAIYEDPAYCLYDDYGNVKEFKDDVLSGNIQAAGIVSKIYMDKGWGFNKNLTMFKEWIKDIIHGNHLEKTGIIFIWDEFTSYLRSNQTDDVLQPLSEFCKEQPFFMCLIVHKSDTWISQIGKDIYERISHRYHSFDFHISEDATKELIAGSILTKAGMESEWKSIKDDMISGIGKYLTEFDNLSMKNQKEIFRNLIPIHPMTISLLSIVAQNFGASQRSIFRFMKDAKESEENVGFINYINTCGPDKWKWLTIDYLWDYFFTRESDVHNFSNAAREAYSHYIATKDSIGNETLIHVFKAAMLLISVLSSANISNLYSKASQRNIKATRQTIRKCFRGMFEETEIDTYLDNLEQIDAIRIEHMPSGDKKLLIPYSGKSSKDIFGKTKEKIKTENSRYLLFKKDGALSKPIENTLWEDKALFYRMAVSACDASKNSIEAKYAELQNDIKKNSHKFGLLAIAISDSSRYKTAIEAAEAKAIGDTTGRIAICVLKEPFTEENLDRWYDKKTHEKIARDENKSSDADRYADEANSIASIWASEAINGEIFCAYRDRKYAQIHGASSLMGHLEKDIILGSVFPYAPETITQLVPVFKQKTNKTAPLNAIRKKSDNNQIKPMEDALKRLFIWETASIDELANVTGKAKAVGKVAAFISEKFSQSSKVMLYELWEELKSKYGYYNCMICGYILGFIMRFYTNKGFSWYKGDNNAHALTEETLADMICKMLKGEIVTDYVSQGSATWKNFKEYAQRIFKLQENEALSETDARKFMIKQCSEAAGVPFWSLKYAEDAFSSKDKSTAHEIIDLFCDFMNENGNPEEVMNNILIKFKGRAAIRTAITEIYFNKEKAAKCFKNFIISKRPEIEKAKTAAGLSDRDLLDSVKQLLQGQISSWTEEMTEAKLDEVMAEYRIIGILNDTLSLKGKSIRELKDIIMNVFNNMKVPEAVIEKLGYEWSSAMKVIRISVSSSLSTLTMQQKNDYIATMEKGAMKAWSNITNPKPILRKYLEFKGNSCTEEELNYIYSQLKGSTYNAPEADFESKISAQISRLTYNRNSKRTWDAWKEKSGFKTINEWCDYHTVPIQWAVNHELLKHIHTIKTIQDGNLAENNALEKAVSYFEKNELKELRDENHIKESFFEHIGDTYISIFEDDPDMWSKLKSRISGSVYTWANRIRDIKQILDSEMKQRFIQQAKDNVQEMSGIDLRSKVLMLLEKHPELYKIFLN